MVEPAVHERIVRSMSERNWGGQIHHSIDQVSLFEFGESIPCPQEEGKLPGPYVPTAQAAREIYQAVARARHLLRSDLQTIVVDESDGWGVLQVIRGTTNDPVGFALEINKCSGAMFARGKNPN